MALPELDTNVANRIEGHRPTWVSLVGLFSLVLGITLVPLILLSAPRFDAPIRSDDALYWTLLTGFWLSPLLLAYAFVLTALRSDLAHWRRGAYLFLAVIFYLAIAAAVGASL